MLGLQRYQLLTLAVLVSGTFITIMNQTVVSPALPSIMDDMAVSASTAQWLTTGFTLVNAIMIPITAYLTDRFSVRGLFLCSMSVFAVGTLLCALSPVFSVLLAGRLVQAAGAGVLMPMVMTVMLLTFPVERRGSAMGIFGVIVSFAPCFGPVIAGLFIDLLDWHFLFFLIFAIALVVIVCGGILLKVGPGGNPDMEGVDKPSVVLSTVGFGSLLYGFSDIGNSGLSVRAASAAVVGVVVLVFFFRRQLSMERPMLQVRVLSSRRFAIGTGISMAVQGMTVANSVLMPIYVQTICGYSATVSALVTLPGALCMGVGGLVAGNFFDKHGPRGLVLTGLSLVTVGTFLFSMLTTSTSMVYLACIMCIRMIGMSMVNMPISTWGINSLDNRLINHGNAVNNTLRQVAVSLGTALVVSIYSIYSGSLTGRLGLVEAQMAGMNFVFALQGFVILAVLVFAFFTVKGDKNASGRGACDAQDPAANGGAEAVRA